MELIHSSHPHVSAVRINPHPNHTFTRTYRSEGRHYIAAHRFLNTSNVRFKESTSDKQPKLREKQDEGSYETTVLVETMYSTSLVQGFMKLNQRLLRVMKEPSLILNL